MERTHSNTGISEPGYGARLPNAASECEGSTVEVSFPLLGVTGSAAELCDFHFGRGQRFSVQSYFILWISAEKAVVRAGLV